MREVLRLEGRGDHRESDICSLCETSSPALYRCNDCFGGELYCQGCIVYLHARTPLHRLQVRSQLLSFVIPKLIILLLDMERSIF